MLEYSLVNVGGHDIYRCNGKVGSWGVDEGREGCHRPITTTHELPPPPIALTAPTATALTVLPAPKKPILQPSHLTFFTPLPP